MRTLILACTLLGLAGCFDSPEDRLLGTWTLDAESFREMEDFRKLPEEQQQMAVGMLESMQMEITFTKDTIRAEIQAFGQKKTDEKPYEVERVDGDRMVLSAKDDKGKTQEVQVELRGDVLLFEMGPGKRVVLKRK